MKIALSKVLVKPGSKISLAIKNKFYVGSVTKVTAKYIYVELDSGAEHKIPVDSKIIANIPGNINSVESLTAKQLQKLIKSAQPEPKELPIELVPSILRADIQRLDKKIRENEKEFKDSVGKISEEELNTLKKNQIIQLNKSVSELNKLVELKAKCSKLIEETKKSLDRVKDKPQSIENLHATKELDVELRKLRKELKGHNNREIELKELVQKLEKSVQSTQEKLIDVDYYKNKIKKLRYDMDILTARLEKASKPNPKVVSFVKNLKLKKENSWSTRGQTLFIEQNGITISYRKDELARNGVLLQDVISYLSTQNT